MVARIRLGDAGPELSRLVAGTMGMTDPDVAVRDRLGFVEELVDLGVTTFDHADIYGDYTVEARFGELLAHAPELRDHIELVTKCGIRMVSPSRPDHRVKHYDSSADHIRASVDASLANLRTDHVDLLLVHRPDLLMDPAETAAALDEQIARGAVGHVGVSNFTPSQFDLLAAHLDAPLVTNQIELSVAAPGALLDGTVDHALLHGRRPMLWSPLGGGAIFGSTPRHPRLQAALAEVGEQLGGLDVGQVALAWLLTHPAGFVPVLGSGRPERWHGYAAAVDVRLDRQQWYAILEASRGHEVA